MIEIGPNLMTAIHGICVTAGFSVAMYIFYKLICLGVKQ